MDNENQTEQLSSRDRQIAAALKRQLQKLERPPSFDAVFDAAAGTAAASRKHRLWPTAAALAMVAASLFWLLQTDVQEETAYIDAVELFGATSWTAPSDALLPEHELDIYHELPVIESTEAGEGALL